MALPIRDGNQSLTTLSTILVSNSHIPAHTVVSLGTQAITDIATAVSGVELGPNTLNALENITVTLGQVTITGGLTDAQLRASAVTIGGSVTATISGTASVTFSQASVTFGTAVVTGSTSILNFPATQTVTFTQASVTFGTAVITGSASILNFPATQTVTFTTAPVTFGQAIVSASNITGLNNSVGTDGNTPTSTNFIKIGGHQDGSNQVEHIVHVSSGGAMKVDASDSTVTFGTAVITGSTSIIGTPSITFGLIAGTVTANPTGTQTIAGTVTANGLAVGATVANVFPIGVDTQFSGVRTVTDLIGYRLPISLGDSNAVVSASLSDPLPTGTNRIGVVTIGAGTVTIGEGTAQIGSVTASISNSVTIASLPAISGTVTANVPFFNFGEGISDGAGNLPIYGIQIGYADSISGEFQLVADNKPIPISGTVTATGFDSSSGISKTIPVIRCDDGIANNSDALPVAIAIESGSINSSNPLPISGTVTANSSNGSLTTRFGSVTTANTAFATSAVTNTNRKYLLIQNITTAANVITVGIGFTPTTTQGIQLFAGAGLTFEGSYIPTGAVNLLSSVTASCYTILEA